MKSLALNLLIIFLLGSLCTSAERDYFLLRRSSIQTSSPSTTTTTTTEQPNSLLAPTKHALTTNPHKRRQRVQLTTTTSSSSSSTTTASKPTNSLNTIKPTNTTTRRSNRRRTAKIMPQHNQNTTNFVSSRLVRDATTTTTINNNIRQNRSLKNILLPQQQQQQQLQQTGIENNIYNYEERRRGFNRHQRQYPTTNNNNTNDSLTSSAYNLSHQTSNLLSASTSSSASLLLPLDGDKRNSTKLQQTPKTPRMIERLAAGHLQNAKSRSTYQVSAVSVNSSITNSNKSSKLYLKNKRPTMLSSSYRQGKPLLSETPRETSNFKHLGIIKPEETEEDNDNDDDEALLEDTGDFDNWDNGILRLSAGSGKETSTKNKKHKEDNKKTLADQVRDGKYGLIEKELFRREPKRPGVISYLANKEVPLDNEHNFGGLNEEDIWLAEDHLLVIKGGSLNEGNSGPAWPPIDDYEAPGRQIKIPDNPKVPPPFPVQLEENGPIQFIGDNKFTVVYPISNETVPIYTIGNETNNTSPENSHNNEKNLLTRPATSQSSSQPNTEAGYIYPAPYPPWLYHNQTFVNPFLGHARPITFPGLGPFPLGRNNTLAKLNGSEPFDEDDPSLYYPPAYTFIYKNNYTNDVAPGPLVPGIILPPPANHFIRFEKTDKISSSSPTITTTTTTSMPYRLRNYLTSTTSSIPITTTTTTPSTTSTLTIPSTTTTTTTESPFRHAITKISQYTPKTIIITPATPTISSKLSTIPPPTQTATSTTTTTTIRNDGYIKPVPVPVAVPVPIYTVDNYPAVQPNIVTFVPTTSKPTIDDTLSKSNPIYYEYFEAKRNPISSNVLEDFLATTKKPQIHNNKPFKIYAAYKRPFKKNNHRQQQQQQSNRQFNIPENVVYITPKPEIRYKLPPQAPIFKPRPIENLEREVQALRQTLRFYQNQQLRDNNIPRTPKAKTNYEYNFDATKSSQQVAPSSFQPPAQFDEEPFKPMVTYSPPVDSENSFRAIVYDKPESKYQSTTALVPVQVDPQPRAKYLDHNYEPYQTTQRTILTTETPWVSIDTKQPQMVIGGIKSKGNFAGYFYRNPQSQQPARQNNRFYDEPFHNSIRKVVQNRPQQVVWSSLENDTNVNYLPNRPAINPDSEYIGPYIWNNPRQPPLSHQSQYYAPAIYPINNNKQQQQQQQQQQSIPLHRDILVNYRQPLPQINPDSEYIGNYRPYRLEQQPNTYYLTPKYRNDAVNIGK